MLESTTLTPSVPGKDARPREPRAVCRRVHDPLRSLEGQPSWAAQLFEAAQEQIGAPKRSERCGAISSFPSLDATILAKEHLLADLARNPDRDELLSRPGLAPLRLPCWKACGAHHDPLVSASPADYAGGSTRSCRRTPGDADLCQRQSRRRVRRPGSDRCDAPRYPRSAAPGSRGGHLCAELGLRDRDGGHARGLRQQGAPGCRPGSPVIGTNKGLFGFQKLPFRIGHG